MSITIQNQKLLVGGEKVPLYAGSVHYWRLKRDLWPRLLDEVRALGLEIITTYIPWSVHEFARGRFDFGRRDNRLDVGAFLDLCAQRGLRVLVRPGPHINAELTYFGFPGRLFAMDDLLARTPRGAPVWIPLPPRAFPAPSYASPRLYEELAVYFDALAPILAERLHHRGGPIIGCQADNECSFFFRTAPYDQDYSQASVAEFRRFVLDRHGGAENLGRMWGSEINNAKDIQPPTQPPGDKRADLPRCLDWARFKEDSLARAVSKVMTMLEDRGITGVLWFHNYPPGNHRAPPFNIPETETPLHVQGADLYQKRHEYEFLKRAALTLSANSRLPFVPEMSSGSTMVIKSIQVEDQRFTIPTVFMHGVKAANYYMIVERERWYGSPIARDGRRREEAFAFFRDWLATCRRARLWDLARRADVLLLTHRDYHRLEHATYLWTPAPLLVLDDVGARPEHLCSEDRFGLRFPVQCEHHRQWEAWYRALSARGFAFALGDGDAARDIAPRYPVVALPSFEFMEPDFQERLLNYAETGGRLVLGPVLPELDLWGGDGAVLKRAFDGAAPASRKEIPCEPFDTSAGPGAPKGVIAVETRLIGRGSIVLVNRPLPRPESPEIPRVLGEVLDAALDGAGVSPLYPSSDPWVETALHEGVDFDVLFVANPTFEERSAGIILPGPRRFEPLDGCGEEAGAVFEEHRALRVTLPPTTVRLYRVTSLGK